MGAALDLRIWKWAKIWFKKYDFDAFVVFFFFQIICKKDIVALRIMLKISLLFVRYLLTFEIFLLHLKSMNNPQGKQAYQK